jgi:hypothetical protein
MSGLLQRLVSPLRVGDHVFVVDQRGRSGGEPNARYLPVTRVGRKYGFVQRFGSREEAFYLFDGRSACEKQNERANGWGFDVYVSEQHWKEETTAVAERERLEGRLLTDWGRLTSKLTAAQVDAIHNILDLG